MVEYQQHIRPNVKKGDIVLYRGKGWISRKIQKVDKSHFNHAGIVDELRGRKLTVEAWFDGTEPTSLRNRSESYENQVMVIRPKNASELQIDKALETVWAKVDRNEKYGYGMMILFWLRLKTLFMPLLKKWDVNTAKIGNDVCSFLCAEYGPHVGIHSWDNLKFPTPEDLLRYLNQNEAEVVFDYRDVPKI